MAFTKREKRSTKRNLLTSFILKSKMPRVTSQRRDEEEGRQYLVLTLSLSSLNAFTSSSSRDWYV